MRATRSGADETRRRTGTRVLAARPRRLLPIVLIGALIAVGVVACTPPLTPGVAYPDLISIIPPGDFGITHPTPTTKEFDYTHMIYNGGEGQLEVQPTNYNAAHRATPTGVQNLYTYDVNNQRVPRAADPGARQVLLPRRCTGTSTSRWRRSVSTR